MDTSAPVSLVIEKNRLDSTIPYIILAKLMFPDGSVMRVASVSDDIVFQGETYTRSALNGVISRQSSAGEMSAVSLSIDNTDQSFTPKLRPLKGGTDATVRLYKVNPVDLSYPVRTATYTVETTEPDDQSNSVVFNLTGRNFLRERLLRQRYFADRCGWQFCSEECGYIDPTASRVRISSRSFVCRTNHTSSAENHPITGTSRYERTRCWREVSSGGSSWSAGVIYLKGTATCKHTLAACRAYGQSSRFGGFPGLSSISVRVAPIRTAPTITEVGSFASSLGSSATRSANQSSQAYSWDPLTLQQEGDPVPETFGTFPAYGNVIGCYIENINGKQYLNVTIDLGMGPVSAIYDHTFNDEPASAFPGVTIETRRGLLDQTAISSTPTKVETTLSTVVAKAAPWRKGERIYQDSNTRVAHRRYPTTPNGHIYKAVGTYGAYAGVTGQTGNVEPTWPTIENTTVFDGIPCSYVTADGTVYQCIKDHTSSARTRPGTGAYWRFYWIVAGSSGPTWGLNQAYHIAYGVTWKEDGAYPFTWTTDDTGYNAIEVDLTCNGLYTINASTGDVESATLPVRVEIKKTTDTAWTTVTRQALTAEKVVYNGRWSAGHWLVLEGGAQVWEELSYGSANKADHSEGDSYSYTYSPDSEGCTFGHCRHFWHWLEGTIFKGTSFNNRARILGNGKARVTRTFPIDLLDSTAEYDLRITKLDEDKSCSDVALNSLTLTAVRKVINAEFQYPRHVLVFIKGLASSSISGNLKYSCMMDGKLVETTINGSTWVTEWSDSPAWVDWHLLTRPVIDNNGNVVRYDGADPDSIALAKYLDLAQFSAAQVSDGSGGYEDRATFNGTFDTTTTVWEACRDVEKIGRFAHIYDGSRITLAIEGAKDPAALFVHGINIVEGTWKPRFLGTSGLASVIEVQIKDRDAGYESKPCPVFNDDLPLPGNPQSDELRGCTKRTEALRYGNRKLGVNLNIREEADFEAGDDSQLLEIGDAVLIMPDDPTVGVGGVVKSATTTSIALDREITIPSAASFSLTIRITDPATGERLETRPVTNTPGTYTTLTVYPAFGVAPSRLNPYALWYGDPLKYTITDIEDREEDERSTRAISVKEYYVYDDGTPSGTSEVPAPKPLRLLYVSDIEAAERASLNENGIVVRNIHVTWSNPTDGVITSAVVYYRPLDASGNGGSWICAGPSTGTDFMITGASPATTYEVTVAAVNSAGKESIRDLCETVTLTTTSATPGATGVIDAPITGLQIFGQANNTTFATRDCKVGWNKVPAAYMRYDAGDEPKGAGQQYPDVWFKDYEVRIYSLSGTLLRTEYVTGESFTYTLSMNYTDNAGRPARSFKIEVRARDKNLEVSRTPGALTVTNSTPQAPAFTLTGGIKSFLVNITPLSDADVDGYLIHASRTQGFTPSPLTLINKGSEASYTHSLTSGDTGTWYIRVAAYDCYSSDTDTISYAAEQSIVVELVESSDVNGQLRGINIVGSAHATKGTYLTASCVSGDTTLHVKDTIDLSASGSGWIIDSANDRDEISWTGKTSTTLTGVTGALAHTVSPTNIPVIIPAVKAAVLADVVNEMRVYADRGDGTIEEMVSLGGGGSDPAIQAGSTDSTVIALNAMSKYITAVIVSASATESVPALELSHQISGAYRGIAASIKGTVKLTSTEYTDLPSPFLGGFAYVHNASWTPAFQFCHSDGVSWYRVADNVAV